MLVHFENLFPKKYEAVGETDLLRAIRLSVNSARGYGLITESARALFALFAFVAGSGFDRDPQFASVIEVLNDFTLNADSKVNRLYSVALVYLDAWLSRLRNGSANHV
jgi:hypothetical protein